MDIDTLGNGTVLYRLSLSEDKKNNMYKLQKDLKFFIDKELKNLSIEAEESKFDEWERCLCSIYTWENLEHKLLMENYFHLADTTDNFSLNDQNELEVKIWLDTK